MSQQQQMLQGFDCPNCTQKQEIIEKYSNLVALLRRKIQKRDQSKSKDSMGSQITIDQMAIGYALRGHTLANLVDKLIQRRLRTAWTQINRKAMQRQFPFIVSQRMIQTSEQTIPHFQEIKSLGILKNQLKSLNILRMQNDGSSMAVISPDFLEELNKSGSKEKAQLRKIFQLQLEKRALDEKVKNLEHDLTENIRRQQKQIAKKRQSLQGLADELVQKHQIIEELKETIKSMQGKLAAKDNVILHRMLEQDSQSMRRVVVKLENINDKLNHDILKLRQEKGQLQLQNKDLSKQNQQFQVDIKHLKEELFSHEHQREQNHLFRRELEIMSQKVGIKLDKLKKIEKKLNQISKIRDSVSTEAMQSEKKVAIQSTLNVLHRSSEMKEIENEDKLQAVFTYLFNIENQGYTIHSPELFDQQEKELLKTHKDRFISCIKAAKDDMIHPISKRVIEDKEHANNVVSFGQSILDVFQEPLKEQLESQQQNTMKLISMEIERSKMIQKISELKEKHLHMRCVILQLLKSLDLRSAKKQTQGILAVLYDFFEYSQEQRAVICQAKTKKFFGII